MNNTSNKTNAHPPMNQATSWLIFLITAVIALDVVMYLVWQKYANQETIPLARLIIAYIITALNASLAGVAFNRERFASWLLLGATLLGQAMIVYFLYVI